MPATGDLHGIIPPIITPTDKQGRVNETALRAVARWLISEGVHGFFVGGTAGEGPLFTLPEYKRLMEIVYDEAGDKVSLLSGVQDTSVSRIIEKINIVKSIGYKYYVVTPTFYIPTRTHDEQMRLFTECHKAGGSMELVPYNIPSVTQGATIAVETFVELARRGMAKYCKESSANAAYNKQLRDAAKTCGLKMLIGDERIAGESMLDGAVGAVNVCSNVEPRTYIKLWETATRGDREGAHQAQERVNALIDNVSLAGPCFLAGSKYWLGKKLNMDLGEPMSPLAPLTAEQKTKLDKFIAASPK